MHRELSSRHSLPILFTAQFNFYNSAHSSAIRVKSRIDGTLITSCCHKVFSHVIDDGQGQPFICSLSFSKSQKLFKLLLFPSATITKLHNFKM